MWIYKYVNPSKFETCLSVCLSHLENIVNMYLPLRGFCKDHGNKCRQVNYLTPTLPPQLDRKAKGNSCKWPCVPGEGRKICMCIHTQGCTRRNTYSYIDIVVLSPPPALLLLHSSSEGTAQNPSVSNNPSLDLALRMILGACQSHFPALQPCWRRDGTTFTGCLICSLRKTVCSERYIGLF